MIYIGTQIWGGLIKTQGIINLDGNARTFFEAGGVKGMDVIKWIA